MRIRSAPGSASPSARRSHPAADRPAWAGSAHQLPFDVAADEARAVAQLAKALEGLGRLRAGEEIPAHDDQVGVLAELLEDGLERRQVAVDVVERGDSQLLEDLEHDATVGARPACPHDRPKRTGDPALPSDHLADVVLRDAELEHGRVLPLDLLDLDRIGIVDEPPDRKSTRLNSR